MESNAAEQLAAISDARAALADRLITPWWYHPTLGLLCAGYVIGVSYGNSGVRIAVGTVFVAAILALAGVYRRRTGIWVSGLAAGRASRWAIALGALVGVVAITAWITADFTDLRWPVWAFAVVGFVGTVVLGRRFDAALRAQLRAAV